ncbi:MAG: tRNA lysidine(34) synthetase TilS [Terriglobales bacterium]
MPPARTTQNEVPRRSSPRPAPLLRRFAACLDRERWFKPGDRVAVAVSGGADSVALFLLLRAVAAPRGLQLSMVHFDHRWRDDSGEDAGFCAQLAAQAGVEFHLGRAATPPTRDREQCARRQRYAFFSALRAEARADAVATAHTADDQAETVLLRLLRGAGSTGLAGILPRRGDGIVRPLLRFRRAPLRLWLRSRNQPWREDPTNAELTHARNRLRLQFLPQLQAAFNPSLVERLASLAELARGEEEFWAAYLDSVWARLWRPAPGGGSFERSRLLTLPLAVQRRVVREAVRRVQGNLRGLDALAVEEILQWLAAASRHPRRRRLAGCQALLTAAKLGIYLADTL